MSFLDKIMELIGKKESAPARRVPPAQAEKKSRLRQVYMSTCRELPEWAQGLDNARIIEGCMEHIVCKYIPHIEFKKIMSTREGFDGNLEAEYEGIAADCGAVKNFGMQIAKFDDMLQPYRYVNLDHIFMACCNNPKRCYFFRAAEGESFDVNRRQRELNKPR